MNAKRPLSLILSVILTAQLHPVMAFAQGRAQSIATVSQAGGTNTIKDSESSDPYTVDENDPYQDSDFGDDDMPETPILTISPSTILEGTVNPTVTISSNLPFWDTYWTTEHLVVHTEGTGLVLTDVIVKRDLTLMFEGTASAGVISGALLEGAFGTDTATTAVTFSIQIVPAQHEEETCTVLFIANNGKDEAAYANVMIGREVILPDYMFSVPDGKRFSGWSINGRIYDPGDRCAFHSDAMVLAIWEDTKTDKEKKIEEVIRLIEEYVKKMTPEEKNDPDAIDLAVLYAETVCAQAASKTVTGKRIELSRTSIAELASIADEACVAAEATLIKGGVVPARELFRTVVLESKSSDISIYLVEDAIQAGVDKLAANTPDFGLSFKAVDIAADLGDGMNIMAQNVGTSSVPKVNVTLPNGATTNSVTLALPSTGKGTENHVIQSEEKKTVVSKRNPFTDMVEGKINASGTYSRQTSEKDFSDISNKSREMQSAIRYLATMGIIDGTTETTFSPDASISRAEIAKLLVTSLGKLNPKATADFTDVTKKNWYYSAAASSQQHGIIKGFEDNTFRGTTPINKIQIVAVASRVLIREMKYKTPSNISSYLSKYSDGITEWAQSEVALATKENLVVYRADGTFSGENNMTRGDAAIIIYRLFQRIW